MTETLIAETPQRVATPMTETPRLYLRRFREDDAAPFAAYRSVPAVARYQTWSAPVSLESALASVRKFASADPEEPGWFRYALESKTSHQLIGDVAIHLHRNLMQAEIGFTVASPFQRQGFGTEAVRAVVRDLFQRRGMQRVSAHCDARNTASANLLQRVGFHREGLRPRFMWLKNEWIDIALFGLLATKQEEAATRIGVAVLEPVQ